MLAWTMIAACKANAGVRRASGPSDGVGLLSFNVGQILGPKTRLPIALMYTSHSQDSLHAQASHVKQVLDYGRR